MPVQRCKSNGKPGYRWGQRGKCYTGAGAKGKAAKQGYAIQQSGYTGNAKPNPLQVDPTRLATLRRQWETELSRRFNLLKRMVKVLIEEEDALGLAVPNLPQVPLLNWSPTQPRDDTGKWTRDGGTGGVDAIGADLAAKTAATGHEHFYVAVADKVYTGSGEVSNVPLPQPVLQALSDPKASVDWHHTHPGREEGSVSFSGADLAFQMAHPGAGTAYLWTPDGSKFSMDNKGLTLTDMIDADDAANAAVRDAPRGQRASANVAAQHGRLLGLHDRGIINYQYELHGATRRSIEQHLDVVQAVRSQLTANYNPTQPRDKYGRWAKQGGAGGYTGKPANPQGKSTWEQHRLPDGTWTPERQALHDRIVAEFKAGKRPPEGEPTSLMMGGGSASGKSTMLKSGAVQVPDEMIVVDSDEIKAKLPEYQAMRAKGDSNAASFCHDESSYLSQRIVQECSAEGYHVMLDGTGDSTLESLQHKAQILRGRGQKVKGVYATVPVQVAVDRSMARAEKTGRMVPETVIRHTHSSVASIVPKAIELGVFDEFELYDTTSHSPVRIASASGRNLTIHDHQRWQDFLARGGE